MKRYGPYSQFNFLVELGGDDSNSPHAGFQQVTGLGMEINAEYRNGNEKDNASRKTSGTYKAPDITVNRGVPGSYAIKPAAQASAVVCPKTAPELGWGPVRRSPVPHPPFPS